MSASPVPPRFSPVPRNPLKTLKLTGCLLGCSPVPPVGCNPMKALSSPVLPGPLSGTPFTPIAPTGALLGRGLGLAPTNALTKYFIRYIRGDIEKPVPLRLLETARKR
jgi:hypothetical protein